MLRGAPLNPILRSTNTPNNDGNGYLFNANTTSAKELLRICDVTKN
jgi:hypothetical protein